jgi:hypothetical protein
MNYLSSKFPSIPVCDFFKYFLGIKYFAKNLSVTFQDVVNPPQISQSLKNLLVKLGIEDGTIPFVIKQEISYIRNNHNIIEVFDPKRKESLGGLPFRFYNQTIEVAIKKFKSVRKKDPDGTSIIIDFLPSIKQDIKEYIALDDVEKHKMDCDLRNFNKKL